MEKSSLHLNLGWQCNCNCVSCPEFRENTHKIAPLQIIKDVLSKNAEIDEIHITGGEPLLHPNFKDILNIITKKHPKARITLLSNGRVFSTKPYLDLIKKYPIKLLFISMYGANAETHDIVTRTPGSFKQTVQGIKSLMAAGYKVVVVIALSKLSFANFGKGFPKLFSFFEENKKNLPIFEFRIVDIIGEAKKHNNALNLDFNLFLKEVLLAADFLELKNSEFYFSKMFPLCVVPEKYHKYVIPEPNQALVNLYLPSETILAPATELFYPDVCGNCKKKIICNGIYSAYAEKNELTEIVPF